jgi:hypothetical protein
MSELSQNRGCQPTRGRRWEGCRASAAPGRIGCVVSPRAAGRLRPPAGSMGGWANSSAVACLQRFNAASTRPPCSQAEAGAVLARPTHALRPTLLSHRFMRTPLAEQEIEAHLSRIFKEREERELAREPSLAQIPRILLRKPPTQAQSSLPQQELGRQARARLREKMSNLVLQHLELEQMWGLLKKHASPPHQPSAFSPLTHASQLGAGPGAARPPHLTPHIRRCTSAPPNATHPAPHAWRLTSDPRHPQPPLLARSGRAHQLGRLLADRRGDAAAGRRELLQRQALCPLRARRLRPHPDRALLPVGHAQERADAHAPPVERAVLLLLPQPTVFWPPGAGSPGCWPRCALGTSHYAAQGPT